MHHILNVLLVTNLNLERNQHNFHFFISIFRISIKHNISPLVWGLFIKGSPAAGCLSLVFSPEPECH